MPAKVRAAASDTTIALGLVRTIVDVVPARKGDGALSLKLICPSCPTETRPRQEYVCTKDESHRFSSDEADRAIEVDKTLRRVTEDEINEIKESNLPAGEINLLVVPAADVEQATLASGALYRLRPKAENDQAYGLLAAFLSDPQYAFICEMTMRSAQKFYRCFVWRGVIVLQELVRPSEFHEADPINIPVDPRLQKMGAKLIEGLVEPFDPEKFANKIRERAAALAEAKRSGAPVEAKPKPVTPKVDSTDALLAMLTASVEAAKSRAS